MESHVLAGACADSSLKFSYIPVIQCYAFIKLISIAYYFIHTVMYMAQIFLQLFLNRIHFFFGTLLVSW